MPHSYLHRGSPWVDAEMSFFHIFFHLLTNGGVTTNRFNRFSWYRMKHGYRLHWYTRRAETYRNLHRSVWQWGHPQFYLECHHVPQWSCHFFLVQHGATPLLFWDKTHVIFWFIHTPIISPSYPLSIPLTHHFCWCNPFESQFFLLTPEIRNPIFFWGGSILLNKHPLFWLVQSKSPGEKQVPRRRIAAPGRPPPPPPPDLGLPKLPKPDVDEIGLDLLARLPQDNRCFGGGSVAAGKRGWPATGMVVSHGFMYIAKKGDNHWIMIWMIYPQRCPEPRGWEIDGTPQRKKKWSY